jgi:hypothetical protein
MRVICRSAAMVALSPAGTASDRSSLVAFVIPAADLIAAPDNWLCDHFHDHLCHSSVFLS